jgi:hypothetical protein
MKILSVLAVFAVFFGVTAFINIGIALVAGIVAYYFFYDFPGGKDRMTLEEIINQNKELTDG